VPRTTYAAIANTRTNTIEYAGMNNHFPLIAAHEISHIIEYRLHGNPFPPFSEGLAYLVNYYFDERSLDIYGHTHEAAQKLLASGNYMRISDIGWRYDRNHWLYKSELSSRTTVTSFVKYMYETYGGENFFQVHWRIFRFEEVYGITIDEMILQWREFLEDYVAGLSS